MQRGGEALGDPRYAFSFGALVRDQEPRGTTMLGLQSLAVVGERDPRLSVDDTLERRALKQI